MNGKKLLAILICLLCVCLAIVLLGRSQAAAQGVRDGLTICGQVIIPSLFPFMVLSAFLACSRAGTVLERLLQPICRHIFHLPQAAATPLLMGLIGGYPVGPRCIGTLVQDGRLTTEDGARMACFCSNAGPPFLISAIGAGMLGDQDLGILLLVCQVVSALLIGICLGISRPVPPRAIPAPHHYPPYSACLVTAVANASSGILSICAFVVLFTCLNALLEQFGIIALITHLLANVAPWLPQQLVPGTLLGVLEVTSGCNVLTQVAHPYTMPVLAALVSFSGLSVICQVRAAAGTSYLRPVGFLLSRLAHAVLSAILMMLLLRLFPQESSVFGAVPERMQLVERSPIGSIFLIGMCCVFLLSLHRDPRAMAKRLRTCPVQSDDHTA